MEGRAPQLQLQPQPQGQPQPQAQARSPASPSDALPPSVTALVADPHALPSLLASVLGAIRSISDTLAHRHTCPGDTHADVHAHAGIGYSSAVGTTNAFGDNQLKVDLVTDQAVFDALRLSGMVAVASSEENPCELDMGGTGFSVAFDPLDGSSIVDANFTVGTILGVWPGRGLLNRTGAEQVASLIAMYGPRTTIALAFNNSATITGTRVCLELTMYTNEWVVTRETLTIAERAKIFAPGNLRATFDNEGYRRLVNYWISERYTLRYTGGLVPDVYHILIKGSGVLSNASSASAKAKLRLLFECAPIALVVEAAGGLTCVSPSETGEAVPPVSLLDVPITDLDMRVGICVGSAAEVQRYKDLVCG